MSILEPMVNDPLEKDVAVFQQLRYASGPNIFAKTDLAINAERKRRSLHESQTSNDSTRQTQPMFADADDILGVIKSGALDAAMVGSRIFGPYGVGDLGYFGGFAYGSISAASLILASPLLRGRSIKDTEKEIWGYVERNRIRRASAGAEK